MAFPKMFYHAVEDAPGPLRQAVRDDYFTCEKEIKVIIVHVLGKNIENRDLLYDCLRRVEFMYGRDPKSSTWKKLFGEMKKSS
ncbi:MAG: hypothetical protein HRU19_30375 [Pseudobacteriovorax sp.]|nr:hypothetical protein [Pseudobacteriovorax sp.]